MISVSTSRTAQLFHVVDQLSQWDQYAHRQYVRWAAKSLVLTSSDSALLKRHAELRKARGWGNGFEQAFLVDSSIAAAARGAVRLGLLRPEEAQAEQGVLEGLAPKLEPFLELHRPDLAALIAQLQQDRARLIPIIAQLRHFAERSDTVRVEVFLAANTDDKNGGGEANGGRIVIEVPSPDANGTVLHESFHVLLETSQRLIRATADSAHIPPGMLNEGIAYALGPGLTDDPTTDDRLAETAARMLQRGQPASDPYVQSNMMALAIRPLLRAALAKGETITAFLPKAVQKWRTVVPR